MNRKKSKRVPRSAIQRSDKKEVRLQQTNIDTKPSWRFSTVDKNGPFSWPIGTDKELDIVGRLHNFDSMEWAEIEGPNNHFIEISKLSTEAKNRLKEIQQDDVDQVFSLRLKGKPRIICIRDRNIAKLLWFDPDHKVCPSKKKHT